MNKLQPPSWATQLFRSFCNDHLSDAVLGDLMELYERRVSDIGKIKADLFFVWNVVQFVQPFALRKKKSSPQNHYAMFRNYFKIAFRSMSRQKMYTGIKIGGFAIGLAIPSGSDDDAYAALLFGPDITASLSVGGIL